MSTPEIGLSSTPSSDSSLTSSDLRTDDLPSLVVNQDQGPESAVGPVVAVIVDDDLGRLGKATSNSESTGLGVIITSSSESESVSNNTGTEDHIASGPGVPKSHLDANRALDGVSASDEAAVASAAPLFTPRGPLTRPTDVKREPKNQSERESESKNGKKKKDSKNKPGAGQKEKKKPGCIIM